MADGAQETAARRRRAVLESALDTFARVGFRTASMDVIARGARISRPGLYFLFDSKEALFREAVSAGLARDLLAIERVLADRGKPLADRLLKAFDLWAGRYVGAADRDLVSVIAEHPDLLDDTARTAPARFERLVTDAILAETDAAVQRAQTLNSVSVGLKQQVEDRNAYRTRLRVAIGLVLA